MTGEYHAVIKTRAIPKGRPRLGRYGAFTPQRTRDYERHIRIALQSTKPAMFTDAICVKIEIHLVKPKSAKRTYPTCGGDLDNLFKAIADAANGVLWTDDSLIVELHASKAYATEDRILISVWSKALEDMESKLTPKTTHLS